MKKRLKQLYEAALNLGMKKEHAEHYAKDAYERERERDQEAADWQDHVYNRGW